MAQIVINEISQNYTYNIGSSNFATVALPITSAWGPCYKYESEISEGQLDNVTWRRFPANQEGLESFVSTYRGPSSIFRMAKDYSYQMAVTLLTAGYDVLVCRIAPGKCASTKLYMSASGDENYLEVRAKYPGTFGNNLKVVFRRPIVPSTVANSYTEMVVYVVDAAGVETAVERKVFVFDVANASDSLLHISEIESNFVELIVVGKINDSTSREDFYIEGEAVSANVLNLGTRSESTEVSGNTDPISEGTEQGGSTPSGDSTTSSRVKSSKALLSGGTDMMDLPEGSSVADMLNLALTYVKARYGTEECNYYKAMQRLVPSKTSGKRGSSIVASATDVSESEASIICCREWIYTVLAGTRGTTAIPGVYSLLQDKLTYNPNRVISPGWDDQDIESLGIDPSTLGDRPIDTVSPIHKALMDVAAAGRCATAFIDIPRSVSRAMVHDTSFLPGGYAQMLSNTESNGVPLYHTHSALFAPWGQYTYAGMSRPAIAPPSFLALMIMRAQMLNQAIQYEWALPTNRKHNLRIGKMDYTVPKKVLDRWQSTEGVGVNAITAIPDLGTNIWGNSTLFDLPPATYQALANLSTRLLVNAIEDVAYRCGINITFQYNNEQAYNKFYAGVTPILDTMKNVGAIEDYYVKMAPDLNGLDQVNANTVIGKIYIVVNGVVNDIFIDLIALPAGTDLNQYRI